MSAGDSYLAAVANCPFCGIFPDEFGTGAENADGSGWTIRCPNVVEGCPQPAIRLQYKKQSRAAWNGRAILRFEERP